MDAAFCVGSVISDITWGLRMKKNGIKNISKHVWDVSLIPEMHYGTTYFFILN